jgi:sRNA-binding protein
LSRKKATEEQKAEANAFHLLLAERFPKAIVHPSMRFKGVRPLKVGIDKDIAAAFPDVPRAIQRVFLSFYVGNPLYTRACTMEGNARVDLDGEAVGRVRPEHVVTANRKREAYLASKGASAADDICRRDGKIGYASAVEALQAARGVKVRKQDGWYEPHAYRCPECHRFHWARYRDK